MDTQTQHPLARILEAARDQSLKGKGLERHANGKPWDAQPIIEITKLTGLGFAHGQATKKATEAAGMVARGEHDAAIRELLGAIVYLAASVRVIEMERDKAPTLGAVASRFVNGEVVGASRTGYCATLNPDLMCDDCDCWKKTREIRS